MSQYLKVLQHRFQSYELYVCSEFHSHLQQGLLIDSSSWNRGLVCLCFSYLSVKAISQFPVRELWPCELPALAIRRSRPCLYSLFGNSGLGSFASFTGAPNMIEFRGVNSPFPRCARVYTRVRVHRVPLFAAM